MAFEYGAASQTVFDHLSALYTAPEATCLEALIGLTALTEAERSGIVEHAAKLTQAARDGAQRGQLVDDFLQQYGLSTHEGVTLMRLCEALIRTPDQRTAHALLRDKVSAGAWRDHVSGARSTLVNLSTRGLQLSAAWINRTGGTGATNLAAKLGDAVLHQAIGQAMAMMGEHFVLGGTIEAAVKKAKKGEAAGYAYSYDMLGEAALTQADADHYFTAYRHAIEALAADAHRYTSIAQAPGISVKLSALHPRYEYAQKEMCVPVLVARVKELCLIAKAAGIGLTLDAEETDRLEISLQIVSELLQEPALADWSGLGVVVQAYQRRAPGVIAFLLDAVRGASRQITVRLVKGAYWDMEIKRAQELGLESYPVFTRKENTDISYLACARALFAAGDYIFPQFATHNGHTAAAIMAMAGTAHRNYEFQRLHGMGEALHEELIREAGVASRVYAPVGRHKNLLPYLVRRLLENGANSSFVNQLLDPAIAIATIVRDPLEIAEENDTASHPKILAPTDQFAGARYAASGRDLSQSATATAVGGLVSSHMSIDAASIIGGREVPGARSSVLAPYNQALIGVVQAIDAVHVDEAVNLAAASHWHLEMTPAERGACLMKAADLLEERQDDFMRLCVLEAGKTWADALGEVREAIDFCRYYALDCVSPEMVSRVPLGVVGCISPWNFPLAIFLGQITAALAAGNSVVAKPAEQTPLVAYEAVKLLYEAGIPVDALHLVLGDGALLGARLVANGAVDGICFTGSTRTAKTISRTLGDTGRPLTPLVAETGGNNVMIVDSTALLEQAVGDTVASAFQSAGQRCSACRIVCVQEDIGDDFITMLAGSMALLRLGDPALLSTDVGPVIDAAAKQNLDDYIQASRQKWSVVGETELPEIFAQTRFVAPVAFEINALSELGEEVFGPVLHVLRFKAGTLDHLIGDINKLGYGLTMGLHTRIDNRVDQFARLAEVGNLYVNRNQIGAVVGVQPFGGEGLSGTGPKAGGPHYVRRFSRAGDPFGAELQSEDEGQNETASERDKLVDYEGSIGQGGALTKAQEEALASCHRAHRALDAFELLGIFEQSADALKTSDPDGAANLGSVAALARSVFGSTLHLPGPTGETNTLRLVGRGTLLCLGGGEPDQLEAQILMSLAAGNAVIVCADADVFAQANISLGALMNAGLPEELVSVQPPESASAFLHGEIDGCVCDGDMREAVGAVFCHREGAILPVLSATDDPERFCLERTLTINTTAAGGNASLLAM